MNKSGLRIWQSLQYGSGSECAKILYKPEL